AYVIFGELLTNKCTPTACTKFDHDSILDKSGIPPRLKSLLANRCTSQTQVHRINQKGKSSPPKDD
ncbi:hypothetical protein P3731_24610, partial [Vibrio parahaemolyticus]|nr:hypothetical protein [Vibrio parahaemolyticus]